MIKVLESDHPDGLLGFLGRFTAAALPTAAASTAIPAEVNCGRWIVRCPFCPSAQLASDQDPRFFCTECHNAGVNGKWLPVAWPGNRKALEAVLTERPHTSNQNWTAGETLQDLKKENARRGL